MKEKNFRKAVTRDYGVLSSELFVRGYSSPRCMEKMFLISDMYIGQAVVFDEWYYPYIKHDIGEKLLREDFRQRKFMEKVFSNIYKFGDNLIKESIKIKRKDLAGLNGDKLTKILRNFFKDYEVFSATLAGWRIQVPIEKKMREILKGRKDIDEELAILSFPEKKNIINEEQQNLLGIAAKMQKEKIKLKTLNDLPTKYRNSLVRHASEYGWMTRGGFDEPWTEKEVFRRIKEVYGQDCKKKLLDIEKNRREMKSRSEKILKEIKADLETRHLVKSAKELVYFRTFRTDYLNLAMFNIRPLLLEIGKRKGYSFREIVQFRVDEIIRGEPVAREELKRRMQNFIIISLNPDEVIFSSDPVTIKKYEKKYFKKEISKADEITGNVAFPGKVRGKAVMVRNKTEIGKMKRGKILVAPMTTPDYVSAMNEASAFVTDEGGITCHAAIIAREMKKPCIIGTKIATKVLKDGDLVEVDANKGIVKILKKNNV